MMRIFPVWISIFLYLLFSCSNAQPKKDNIAILELKQEGLSDSEARIFTSRLRRELFNTNKFSIIERERMKEILNEQGLQLSGCTSDECAIEAGKLLGVGKIITGDVGKIGSLYIINIRMINVETGKILKIASQDCQCSIEEFLTKTVRTVAMEISNDNQVQNLNSSKPFKELSKTNIHVDENKKNPQFSEIEVAKKNKFGFLANFAALKSVYSLKSDFGYSFGILYSYKFNSFLSIQPEVYYSKYKWMIGRISGSFTFLENYIYSKVKISNNTYIYLGPSFIYPLDSGKLKENYFFGFSTGISYEYKFALVSLKFLSSENFSNRYSLALGILL